MDKQELLELKNNIINQFNNQHEVENLHDYIEINRIHIINSSGLFDVDFYLSEYPEVKQNPIEHYVTIGVDKEYNPNANFSTKSYQVNNPDVANTGINPFVHYLLWGIHENRVVKDEFIEKLEKKYKVSIIMPTFNRKQIISTAIDSVLKQTFQNFELIIIDDGSDDQTDKFINEKYWNYLEIKKIKYYQLNHKGVSFARNFGLNKSEGNIIAYLDSDNFWNNKFLEFMLEELDSHVNYDCAYCQVRVKNTVKNTNYILSKKFDRKELLKENFIDLNSFIHTKKLFEEHGGFNEKLTRLVDWDLIIRFTKNHPPLFVEKILVNYFIAHDLNNITTTVPLDKNMELIRQKYWKELYSDEYDDLIGLFDNDYYLETNEDVLKSGINPIYHYLYHGYHEGREPTADFDSKYYELKHPEVVKKGLNPFIHYIQIGKNKNFKINPLDESEEILNNNLLYLSNYSFDNPPLVSIIILNRNGLDYLKELFINFAEKTNYPNFEIIVVDNNSSDDSVNFLKSLADLPIRIIENRENVSFSKGNNDAVKKSNGDYLLFMNNDMETTYGWLNEMMGVILNNENVGAVGAKLIFPFIYNKNTTQYSFTIQHAGDVFRKGTSPCGYNAFNKGKFLKNVFDSSVTYDKKCLLVTGATLLTKKDIFLKLGGFDENFWYGYEDVDYNLRLYKYGYNTIFASAALLFHKESATRKNIPVSNNHKLLCNKWGGFLFKKILEDKINRTEFFTDEKLSIQFIANKGFNENEYLKRDLHILAEFFKSKKYNLKISTDLNYFNMTNDVDIIISVVPDYSIENVDQKNIIKVLVLNNSYDNYNSIDYTNWDILIVDDENIYNRIQKECFDVSIFCLNDYSRLGEQIIFSLQKTFLKY